MASGRTVSASLITVADQRVLNICRSIAKALAQATDNRSFDGEYGAIHMSRDGATGRGGGKLQRDALCTRGRQGKAPYSNRNLRWHPLVVADSQVSFAKPVQRVEIEGEGESSTLLFVVDEKGHEKVYPADKVHEIPRRHVVLPKHWMPHLETLKHWSDVLWTSNSCVIAAEEACNQEDAVATYAILGIAAVVALYEGDFELARENVADVLQKSDFNVVLPTAKDDYISCPVCRKGINESLGDFRKFHRLSRWQPGWRKSKQNEGEDDSTQILHVNPLTEQKINHIAGNVRLGHRWCNIAMSDHSLEETVDFMTYVAKVHGRIK